VAAEEGAVVKEMGDVKEAVRIAYCWAARSAVRKD
jgi:hypothetical protein